MCYSGHFLLLFFADQHHSRTFPMLSFLIHGPLYQFFLFDLALFSMIHQSDSIAVAKCIIYLLLVIVFIIPLNAEHSLEHP